MLNFFMKTERIIAVYEKSGDRLIKEIDAGNLDKTLIQSLFIAYDDDPEYYGAYQIGAKQYDKLTEYISK